MEKALADKGRNPVSEFCRWNPENSAIFEHDTILRKSKYQPNVNQPLVYHLNGVVDVPQSMVLTEKDYRDFIINLNRIEEKEILPPAIRIVLAQTSLLFVGYSLEDITFRNIFQGIIILLNPKRQPTNIAVREVPPLGMTRTVPGAQYAKFEDRIKRKCETSAMYAMQMFGLSTCWGNSQRFLQDLRERWNRYIVDQQHV